MNLDDPIYFQSLDAANLLGQIDRLPEQVAAAWDWGQTLELPDAYRSVRQIVLAGMGAAGQASTLTQAFAASEATRPITLLQSEVLPAFVGPDTLVIAASVSGNTEETLAVSRAALTRRAPLLVITGGGALVGLAEERAAPIWAFEHIGAERTALGWLWMLTLAALMKAGALRDPSAAVAEAVAEAQAQKFILSADSPVARNPAKRLAGQLMHRAVTLFAAHPLKAVARRWCAMLAQNAKAAAHAVDLPEATHHFMAGTLQPEALIDRQMMLFLRAPNETPFTRHRAESTRALYLTSGFSTDAVEARGQSALAHMLTALHFGEYVAYYLAMAYGLDPSPVPQIEFVKQNTEHRRQNTEGTF